MKLADPSARTQAHSSQTAVLLRNVDRRTPHRPHGLRLRVLDHAGAEQSHADGVRHEFRLCADDPAHAGRVDRLHADDRSGRRRPCESVRDLSPRLHDPEICELRLPRLAGLEDCDLRAARRERRRSQVRADDLHSGSALPVGKPQGMDDGADGRLRLHAAGGPDREPACRRSRVRRDQPALGRFMDAAGHAAAPLPQRSRPPARVQRDDGPDPRRDALPDRVCSTSRAATSPASRARSIRRSARARAPGRRGLRSSPTCRARDPCSAGKNARCARRGFQAGPCSV